MKLNMSDVWEMINNLSSEEKKIIYKRMQEDIRFKMNDILERVNERAEADDISIEEITKEVENVRGSSYGKN